MQDWKMTDWKTTNQKMPVFKAKKHVRVFFSKFLIQCTLVLSDMINMHGIRIHVCLHVEVDCKK